MAETPRWVSKMFGFRTIFGGAVTGTQCLLGIVALAVGAAVLKGVGGLGSFLIVRDTLAPADLIVVLNGDVNGERTQEAARLYKAGWAPKILFTGDVSMGPGDSALAMRADALRLGVPEEAIFIEPRAKSTVENVQFVRPLLEHYQFRTVILVTHPYHQRRAWLLARKAWGGKVRIINAPCRQSFWSPQGWWERGRDRRIVLREWMKLMYHWIARQV